LATLYNAETELNNDLSNAQAVSKYISAAKTVAKNLDAKYGETWRNPSGRTESQGGASAAAAPAVAAAEAPPAVGGLSKAQIKRELQKATTPEPAGSRVQVESSEDAAASSTTDIGNSFRDINEATPGYQFEEGIEEVEGY
jgi:hypothetical protein